MSCGLSRACLASCCLSTSPQIIRTLLCADGLKPRAFYPALRKTTSTTEPLSAGSTSHSRVPGRSVAVCSRGVPRRTRFHSRSRNDREIRKRISRRQETPDYLDPPAPQRRTDPRAILYRRVDSSKGLGTRLPPLARWGQRASTSGNMIANLTENV